MNVRRAFNERGAAALERVPLVQLYQANLWVGNVHSKNVTECRVVAD